MTPCSQPKMIWLETTKTNASETSRVPASSTGTGLSSARTVSAKKRAAPTSVPLG
jgi:hypothetical protein